MHKLIFVLGGARSGKSSYAEALAATLAAHAPVLYVATAEAWDDEMHARITRHREQRPAVWRTLEAPRETGSTIHAQLHEQPAAVVLIDCLTLLTSNVVITLPEDTTENAALAAMQVELDALLHAYAQSDATWIIVSNEVGLGIVPPYPLGRLYRDVLGRANQQVAAAADEVVLLVAGLPLPIKPGHSPWPGANR
jgi:adenosylcobinamide kinase / adenosylcobinamide-phosphate guanylyltransferase